MLLNLIKKRKTQNLITFQYHRGDKPVFMNRLPTQVFLIKRNK